MSAQHPIRFIGHYVGLVSTVDTTFGFTNPGSVRCDAITKKGERCKLLVRYNPFIVKNVNCTNKFEVPNKNELCMFTPYYWYDVDVHVPRVCYCNSHKGEYAKVIQKAWRLHQTEKKNVFVIWFTLRLRRQSM